MRHDRLLRTTLTVNAVVSGLAGVATAALSGLLAVSPSGLTTVGHWVIGIVTLGVADFAVLQWLGARRLGHDATVVSSSPRGRQPVAP